ncbi:major facilitator superfamily domain-containing protein [Penicillium angulare]|uniref:Major facilitator superfamily domain-containing protein n=1 Tax=Penicillium angulare TaxID=116970 RepID=A0A9W9FV75_9EURO|nr:major facilitator superfamily domain-containing protein [Penicillium angulare]
MEGNERTPLLQEAREDPIQEPREDEIVNSEKSTSRLVIYGAFMGVFLAAADESLLLSTWSMIASEFDALSWGSWLLMTYNLGYCMSLPVYGVLCGSFGRKNVLLGAYTLFAIGCIVCGTSVSYAQLVFGRFIAGVSGGGMVSLVSILITDLVPPADVAVLRGYANVINATARSLGAPLGGILIDSIGWRWSFYGHLPLIAFCILITIRGVPSDSNKSNFKPEPDESEAPNPGFSGFDFGGLISFFIAIILFFATLQELESANQTWRLATLFSITIVAILTFILVEVYWAKRPLIKLALFRTSIGAYLANQVMMTSSHSVILSNFVPYLIRLQNTTNLFATTKRYKPITVIAVCGLAIGFLVMLLRWRVSFERWELVYLFPSGIFLGILFVTQFTAMSQIAPKEELAQCITTYYFFQQLGSILGPATSVVIVQHSFQKQLERSLKGLPAEKLISKIVNDERFAWNLSPDVLSIVQRAYRHAFQFAPSE